MTAGNWFATKKIVPPAKAAIRLDTAEEVKWRAEFDEAGEREVRFRVSNPAHMNHQPQRQFALRWLREQDQQKKAREQEIYRYTRLTL